MMETLYQIKQNGMPFAAPVPLEQKNDIMRALSGTLVNVEITRVLQVSDPVFKVIEGGRK